MTGRFVRSFAAVIAALLIGAGAARAQTPVLSPASANGSTISFEWTATAGATGYRLDAGISPTIYSGSLVLGVVTRYAAPGVMNGVYFVRVVALTAGGDVPSNEVRVQLPAPPAPPTNLQVVRNGQAVVALWTPGAGGGTATSYQLRVGLTAGATDVTIPVVGTTFAAGPAPVNTYFFRVVGVNAAGASTESNEVMVVMPAGGACDVPPSVTFSNSTFITFLSVAWSPVPSAIGYLASATQNGVPLATDVPVPASFTSIRQNVGLATYTITIKAQFACGTTGVASTTTVAVDGAPPPGPRTADPAPGTLLPVPGYGASVVNQLAAARPDLVAASCREFGGNNRFMFEVVKALRARDNRWGLNWKRGNAGDVSQDIVSYNRSALPDEGATTGPTAATRNISIFDMIGAHCGPRPGPNWEDVTGVTIERGARAVWTLLPFIEAGHTP